MGTFYSGKDGNVNIASADWKLSEWGLDLKNDIVDTTNFTSSGYKENITGLTSGTITCKGPYDTGAMAATVGTSYAFVLKVGGAVTFSVTARITNIKVGTSVDGKAEVEITAESTGSFTAAIA